MGPVSTRAVVLPATPLLVPGAAGRTEVLREARAATLGALHELLARDAPVVVVAAVPGGGLVRGLATASLAAAGVPSGAVDPSWVDTAGGPGATTGGPPPRAAGVGASVALLALGAAGVRDARDHAVDVVELGPDVAPGTARDLGRELRAAGVSVVVADDPRSAATAVVLDAFVDGAWSVRSERLPGVPDGQDYEVRRYVGTDAGDSGTVGAPGRGYRSARDL